MLWISFLLLAVIVLWTAYIQWKIADASGNNQLHRTTYGIVLGAALWNNVPSPALKERLNRAIQLYETGYVKKLIVTGGIDNNGAALSEAEGMANYLDARGIPETNVILEKRARSTYENLLYSINLVGREKLRGAIIITHDYHGARALDIARYLHIDNPQTSTMNSQVMWMPRLKARETLAYTKWLFSKWTM